jgi:predicted N-acyltransferase
VPLYLKTSSEGEFVFDYGWANAYEQAGGSYYPKLQGAVPFTPVPGRRLLLKPGADVDELRVLQMLRELTDSMLVSTGKANVDVSSLHITFCPKTTYERVSDNTAWLQRTGTQFHFYNRGYKTFQDFLDTLSARKRKAIRKEREAVHASGLELLAVTGAELQEEHWDAFYAFYMDTCNRKWGRAALNRKFFTLLHERMADRVVLMLARDGGRYVAGALNLLGDTALYGRNWGALAHYPFLHFELCYYQAIDFAIARGLAKVEAGAQGLHKVARGYEPESTYSLHYIRDPRFRAVLRRVLEQERAAIQEDQEEIAQHVPFRKGPGRAEE